MHFRRSNLLYSPGDCFAKKRLAMTFKDKKEARMKIQINYIFWKQGPLLFDFAQNMLPRFLAFM